MTWVEVGDDVNICANNFIISDKDDRCVGDILMADSPSFIFDFLQVLKEIEARQNR